MEPRTYQQGSREPNGRSGHKEEQGAAADNLGILAREPLKRSRVMKRTV